MSCMMLLLNLLVESVELASMELHDEELRERITMNLAVIREHLHLHAKMVGIGDGERDESACEREVKGALVHQPIMR